MSSILNNRGGGGGQLQEGGQTSQLLPLGITSLKHTPKSKLGDGNKRKTGSGRLDAFGHEKKNYFTNRTTWYRRLAGQERRLGKEGRTRERAGAETKLSDSKEERQSSVQKYIPRRKTREKRGGEKQSMPFIRGRIPEKKAIKR